MKDSTIKKTINWSNLTFFLGVILITLSLIFWLTIFKFQRFEKAKSDWQAVFLTNNQVYFGKITKMTDKEIVLKDVYYLSASQILPERILPEDKKGNVIANQESFLIKLGSEIHEPQDELRINRDHILFIEDLKNDSPIVEAIKQYRPQ